MQERRFVKEKLGRQLFKDYERLFQECWNARYDPFFKNVSLSKPQEMFNLAKKFMNII